MSDLVDKIRKRIALLLEIGENEMVADFEKTIARILELEAENKKLAAGVCHDCLSDEHGNLRCSLLDENKKLKEALKPFKTRLEDRSKFEEATYGSSYRAGDSFEIYVPIGDLRGAAAALGEKP